MTLISLSGPLFLLLISLSLQIIPGFSDDAQNDTHSTSSVVIIIFIVFVAVALFSFFLFKLWQKKKREEQYARLLKLFEEDDELELELGLRD